MKINEIIYELPTGGEVQCGMSLLLEDLKATTYGTPDDGVVVEFDSDVPCLRDLLLVSHTNGDEVWGYINPKALEVLARTVLHTTPIQPQKIPAWATLWPP